MLIGMVLAEQQFRAGGQLRTHARRGTAAIAAISPREFGAGQSCGHGSSVSFSAIGRCTLSRISTLSDVFSSGLVP
ncbi:hypothetical protein AU196_20085 [Mycobacterium sp. IS-1742]|nr:hypothetical protein AU196_20085 [Mycobacterium sp. IS-1742]